MDVKKTLNNLKDEFDWTYTKVSRESGVSYNTVLRVMHDNYDGTTVSTLELLLNAFGYELAIKPIKKK